MESIGRVAPRALAVLALGGAVAFAIAVPGHAAGARAARTFENGAFSGGNSADGSAILSAVNMRPGDEVTGSVGISNDGDIPGDFTLSSSIGSSSGAGFASSLVLSVTDATTGRTVFAGPMNLLSSVDVGRLSAGERHVFRFLVDFPEHGAADNALAGASTNVTYSWTARSIDGAPTGTTSPPTTDTTPPPPPPTNTGSTSTPPPPDTQAPRLVIAGPAAQSVRSPYVTVRCDEPCRLAGSATVSGVKGVSKLTLSAPAGMTPAGQTVRITVHPSGKAAKLMAWAIQKKRKVTIAVKVQATDAAGNAASFTRSVRGKR